MKIVFSASALCLAMVLAGQSATAESLGEGVSKAVLVSPAPAPSDAVIDGRIWHCQAETCTAAPNDMADDQSVSRECHRAAVQLGPFASYQTGDKTVAGPQLDACNANVAKKAR